MTNNRDHLRKLEFELWNDRIDPTTIPDLTGIVPTYPVTMYYSPYSARTSDLASFHLMSDDMHWLRIDQKHSFPPVAKLLISSIGSQCWRHPPCTYPVYSLFGVWNRATHLSEILDRILHSIASIRKG